LLRGCCGQLDFGLASLRCRALGLLYHGTLKKSVKLVADLSPLRGGRLRHCPEEYCRSSDVLTCPCEEWGLIAPLIIVNAAIDVTCPMPGCSTITLARTPLLEGGPKGH
jgi:hypothetical protein